MGFFDGMSSHDKLILVLALISGIVVVFGMVLFSNASVNFMNKLTINHKGDTSNGKD